MLSPDSSLRCRSSTFLVSCIHVPCRLLLHASILCDHLSLSLPICHHSDSRTVSITSSFRMDSRACSSRRRLLLLQYYPVEVDLIRLRSLNSFIFTLTYLNIDSLPHIRRLKPLLYLTRSVYLIEVLLLIQRHLTHHHFI